MDGLAAVLEAFRDQPVLVVGDALLDEYVVGDGMRICREGPAPAVHVTGRDQRPGGAANVAANACALGADVCFVGLVGDDVDGAGLRHALVARGVDDHDLVVQAGRRTPAKRRIVLDRQLLLRLDEDAGEAAAPARDAEDELLRRLRAGFTRARAVVVSDYGAGTVTERVLQELARLQERSGRVLVVDAHDLRRYRDVGARAVTPSYEEVWPLLDRPPPPRAAQLGRARADRADEVVAVRERLLQATGADVVAVTLDVDGAVVLATGSPPYRTHTRPAAALRACGAGDTYAAALALSLGAGAPVTTAAELAQRAATLVTAREGTVTCPLEDLHVELGSAGATLTPPAELARVVAYYRRQGRRVVFTNGCFDLLHRGHVDLLRRASRLGDVLVVGLNTDASVRRLKGPERPVNPLADRAQVLAALGCVDHITSFDQPVASGLVDLLRPDVYVKGGDYTPQMLPEAAHVEAYGGVVRILPYTDDRSTTSLIQRIRS